MSSHRTPSEPIRFGKYMLMERLGVGGMGEVWKAKSTGPGGFSRTVALKRVLPDVAEDGAFLEMLFSEARLAARLHHENIIQVFELGDVDGEHFIVMEYVEGYSLLELIRSLRNTGPLTPAFGAMVLRGVCRGLAHSHAHRDEVTGRPAPILHRDVTPSNVIVGVTGGVKIVDFGVAKALGDPGEVRTHNGMLKGKLGYLSPEQVSGDEVDSRSDLFSAGIVLHECLTGRRLFRGRTDDETIELVKRAVIPKPSELNPLVPSELDAICVRALAPNREQRFATADEMAAALDEIIEHERWNEQVVARTVRQAFPTHSTFSAPSESSAPASAGRVATKRRSSSLHLAALAVLLAAGGVLWAARRSLSSTSAPQARPTPSSIGVARDVAIAVDTLPDGASIFVAAESKARGTTPFVLRLPASELPLAITFKKVGWETAERRITADDSRLQVELTRVQPVATPHVHTAKAKAKATARPKQSSRPASSPSRDGLVEPRWR